MLYRTCSVIVIRKLRGYKQFRLNCIYWINSIHTYMYICLTIDCFIIYLRIRKPD